MDFLFIIRGLGKRVRGVGGGREKEEVKVNGKEERKAMGMVSRLVGWFISIR